MLMPVISSHVLDSVEGCDAAGIRVSCIRLMPSGEREPVVEMHADDSGRIAVTVDTAQDLSQTRYQLIFFTGEYFSKRHAYEENATVSAVRESVVHMDLSSVSARCPVPMMIAPHSHSVWWSRQDH